MSCTSDNWIARGEDRCCDYCGSMHPEEILALCERIISDEDKTSYLTKTDKNYKFYVERPTVEGEKGTKFYTDHIPTNGLKEFDEEWMQIFRQALYISKSRSDDNHKRVVDFIKAKVDHAD